jgi:aryl-alcohol dehydrogenase-like predicted oxidoreductase
MTSRLVLGAATYGRMSQNEVNALLGAALESGITKLDTAHGYEGSERRIGFFLKNHSQFEVNTKAGLPDQAQFTPKGIRLSVEESLRRLGVESLNTLFVHSLDSAYLSERNIDAMLLLKREGKIQRIGYAGDNENLSTAVGIPAFDDFMATFNIIDQSNGELIKSVQSNSEIYYKLALGQAVWTKLELRRRIKSNKAVRFLFRKPPEPESWIDYCARFSKFQADIVSEDFAATFLRFALFSGTANQRVILGTHSSRHIRFAAQIEQDRLNPEALTTAHYEDLWSAKSSPEWRAHTG